MAPRLRQMELSTERVYGPVLKTTQLSAHAQNHGSLYVAVNLLPPSFSATTISLNRFKFWQFDSIYGNFSHIFTAHAQKRLSMNFRSNSDITIRFRDPDFLMGHDISPIQGHFLLIFALDKLNVRHISTFGLVDLLT